MGRTALDLAGQVFGRLTVLRRAEPPAQQPHRSAPPNRAAHWLCACVCGNTKVVPSFSLRNGSVRSCGCLGREVRHALGVARAAQRRAERARA
jgi:hypothetical protein